MAKLVKFVIYDELDDMDHGGLLFEEVSDDLEVDIGTPILAIGDLGFWDGRRQGYRIFKSGVLSDILVSSCTGQSTCSWRSDGRNVRGEEAHHDGVNRYLYRAFREGCAPGTPGTDALLADIAAGKEISSSRLNRYTRSIAPDVAEALGMA